MKPVPFSDVAIAHRWPDGDVAFGTRGAGFYVEVLAMRGQVAWRMNVLDPLQARALAACLLVAADAAEGGVE